MPILLKTTYQKNYPLKFLIKKIGEKYVLYNGQIKSILIGNLNSFIFFSEYKADLQTYFKNLYLVFHDYNLKISYEIEDA